MPALPAGLYRVTVGKKLGEQRWTNVYIVAAPNIGDAHTHAAELYAREKLIHTQHVTLEYFRTDDGQLETDIFRKTQPNEQGSWVHDVGEHLPLFNRFVFDFSTEDGRPSRKYICSPVFEGDQLNGKVLPATKAFLMAQYGTFLAAASWYVDIDGQAIIEASVKDDIGMRQMRRKRRKKVVAPAP